MTALINSQLLNTTVNLPAKTRWFGCSVKQPCQNGRCRRCWRTTRKNLITKSVVDSAEAMRLSHFLTITVLKFHGTASEAYNVLMFITPAIAKKIGKSSKYLMVRAVVKSKYGVVHFTPHFHFIVSKEFKRKDFEILLNPRLNPRGLRFSVRSEEASEARGGLPGLVGYFIDKNILPSLNYKPPRRFRLISGSRGLCLSRIRHKNDDPLLAEHCRRLWGL